MRRALSESTQRGLIAALLLVELAVMAQLRPEPRVYRGDEPHYLLVAHSLLFDHDLDVADDYFAAKAGGVEAGRAFRHVWLDHHTILIDRDTGDSALWIENFDVVGRRISDRFPDKPVPIERSAHPVVFPALIAGVIALSRPDPDDVEARFQFAVLLLGWLTLVFVYLLARRVGLGRALSLAATGVLLCSPWTAYSFGYFSETTAGLFVTLAMFAFVSRRLTLAACALAMAVAIKPALVLIGGGWIVARWFAGDRRGALRFAAVLAAFGSVLVLFNVWQTGSPIVSGHTGWVWVRSFRDLPGTLIDGRYGLLRFVPWVGVVCVGAAFFSRHDPRRFLELVGVTAFAVFVVLVPFGALGGTAYGCRYWIWALPIFTVAAAYTWRLPSRSYRLALVCAVVVTAVTSLPSAAHYREHWDGRPTDALLQRGGRRS